MSAVTPDRNENLALLNVCFGSLADIATSQRDVRFTQNADISWRQSNVR